MRGTDANRRFSHWLCRVLLWLLNELRPDDARSIDHNVVVVIVVVIWCSSRVPWVPSDHPIVYAPALRLHGPVSYFARFTCLSSSARCFLLSRLGYRGRIFHVPVSAI